MSILNDNYSLLGHPDWVFVEKQSIEEFTSADWLTLEAQRKKFISQVKRSGSANLNS